MGRIALQAVAAMLLATACYDKYTPVVGCEPLEEPTLTIAELRARCSERVATIDSRMVIVGRVTTSDEEGNFYRSFFIEDATGGVELLSGLYDNHSLYPPGLRVSMSLEGCAAVVRENIVQIGLPTDPSAQRPASFDVPALLASYMRRDSSVSEAVATPLDYKDLRAELCGRLVVVSGVRYEPLDEAEHEASMDGYRRFVTRTGEDIYCYTSDYADFADRAVPRGEVSLRGILYYENVGAGDGRHYVIKPSFWSDVTSADNHFAAAAACCLQ